MGLPKLKDDILETLYELRDEDQKRVLEFARGLANKRPRGKPVAALLRHVGRISPEDLDRMAAAIEEECEQVNPNGW